MVEEVPGQAPICLTVPGLGCSGPGHWQTIWEAKRDDCARIELGCWDAPIRNVWISRIDQAVVAARSPVVLVAHSLGCLAVACWASLVGAAAGAVVRGALLVAPPDADRPGVDERLAGFAPVPRKRLPFPTIVVASSDDPYASIARSEGLASAWQAEFVDVGALGHVNASSGLGAWQDGQALLARLIDRPPVRYSVAPGRPRLARYWDSAPR